ncbi:MAG: cupin domain-containing protein [Gammaproteobacteria bacterium]
MRINADYTQRVVETPVSAQWRPSPAPGVERRMLDRIGEEVAVATSVVRYAPGSRFPVHIHEKGEEFLVLDGVFSDDSGDYGAGSYVRNPPGSSHAPWTDDGTTIFVKLRQFDPADLRQFSVDTVTAAWSKGPLPGIEVLELHAFDSERVEMLKLESGAKLPARSVPQGEEIYVVEGRITDVHGSYDADTWIRNPCGTAPGFEAAQASLLWRKSGHLHPQLGPAK